MKLKNIPLLLSALIMACSSQAIQAPNKNIDKKDAITSQRCIIKNKPTKKITLQKIYKDNKVHYLDRRTSTETKWKSLDAKTLNIALKDNKFIVIYIYIDDCNDCYRQEAAFRDKKIIDMLDNNFIATKLNAQKNALLFLMLGVEPVFPSILMLSPNYKLLGVLQGVVPNEVLYELLEKMSIISEEINIKNNRYDNLNGLP